MPYFKLVGKFSTKGELVKFHNETPTNAYRKIRRKNLEKPYHAYKEVENPYRDKWDTLLFAEEYTNNPENLIATPGEKISRFLTKEEKQVVVDRLGRGDKMGEIIKDFPEINRDSLYRVKKQRISP